MCFNTFTLTFFNTDLCNNALKERFKFGSEDNLEVRILLDQRKNCARNMSITSTFRIKDTVPVHSSCTRFKKQVRGKQVAVSIS